MSSGAGGIVAAPPAPASAPSSGGGGNVEWHVRPPNPKNPVVFFDVSIGGIPAGRIKMELFADIAPKTAENFRQFCTGELRKAGKPLGYKECQFHRVIKDFMIQSGDFLKNDGNGCMSIYGHKFDDENFTAKHTGPGLLSMVSASAAVAASMRTVVVRFADADAAAYYVSGVRRNFLHQRNEQELTLPLPPANSGPDTNGCQFFISCAKCEWLDNKHVVFGRVLGDGLLVMRKIENVAVGPNNRPKLAVVITECGEM
ncbi:hypothetical protein YC2023_047404 [Brassica napus]